MAKRQASQFINTVIYQVDKNSLKKIRDTNKKLQKEFEKASPMGGSGRSNMAKQKANMDNHLKLREKHLNKVAKLEERSRERSKRAAAKSSKQGFRDSISGLSSGGGGGSASKTAFADMLRDEQRLADAKLKERVRGERRASRAAEVEAKRSAKRREKIEVFVEDKLGHAPSARRAALKQDLLRERSTVRLNQTMRNIVKKEKERSRELRKQNALTNRMSGSAMQLAGGLFSVFTAIEALTAVTQTGMQFEAVNKAMLVSSENAAEAKKHLAFVREESMRLGVPLLEASKTFSGFLAAAGDKTSIEDIKGIFTGVAEAATVLGLSADDTKGTFLAIKQMFSKGKIQADELTQQLGERMPFAMRAMTKAAFEAGLIDKSTPEKKRTAALMKLMEQGKLIAGDVLPEFGRQLRLLANDNDGLAHALDNNLSPAMGRASNHLTEMQNEFFKGGWKDSLMFLMSNFNDQAGVMKNLAGSLGGFAGSVIEFVVAPFQLALAVILDIKKEFQDLLAFDFSGMGFMDTLGKIFGNPEDTPEREPVAVHKFITRTIPDLFRNNTTTTPYRPSNLGGGILGGIPNSAPTKVEVTVRGTDGLIEVVDARVDDGIQNQLNSVLSTTGEQ